MSKRVTVAATAAVLSVLALAGLLLAGRGPAPTSAAAARAGTGALRSTRAAGPRAAVSAPARRERARMARRLGRGALVQADPRTGGVRVAVRPGRFLTGPGRGSARGRALGYVARHRAAFGLDRGDLHALRPAGARRLPGGTRVVRWRQQVRGIPFVDGQLRAVVDRRGRIAQIDGGAIGGLDRTATTPRITGADAVARAAAATGGAAPKIVGRAPRRLRLAGRGDAHLVLASAGGPHLAWRVVRSQDGALLDQLIDARTGSELRRTNRTVGVAATAYDSYPGAPVGGAPHEADLGDDLAPGATKLEGGGVHAFADLNDDDVANAGEDVTPQDDGSWRYARRPFAGADCPPAGCSWLAGPGGPSANREHAATQAFVTVHSFRKRLAAQPIGFSFGDAMDVQVDDGAEGKDNVPMVGHINNANMAVRPEGQGTRVQMYLWGSHGGEYPRTDGADDPSVLEHEVVHGLSMRLVTDPEGWGALTLIQPGAIGEALSDFFALDDLVKRGVFPDSAAAGDVWMAPHVDPGRRERHEAIDCPVLLSGPAPGCGGGGFTFDQFGKIAKNGPEVHADGEIIGQTLWDLRTRLIARDGAAVGVLRAEGELTGALKLVPAEPTFLDLRNALLVAARDRGGAADEALVWDVFADRGMGVEASTPDPDSTEVKESFARPATGPTPELTGVVRDRDSGEPVTNAHVVLAGHDAPGDHPLAADTNADGEYRISAPVGLYPHVVVTRSGFERTVDAPLRMTADPQHRDIAVRRNWAALASGGTIAARTGRIFNPSSRVACADTAILDGRQATGLVAYASDQPAITVKLPKPITVTSVVIDPTPVCGAKRAAGLGDLLVEVAGHDGDFHPAVTGRFEAGSQHERTELRPTAPLDRVEQVRLTLQSPVDASASDDSVSLTDLEVFSDRRVAPRAGFTHAPALLRMREPVQLEAAAPASGEPSIGKYAWDLDGDGTYEKVTGTAPRASTEFTSAGDHTVGLRVTSTDGQTDTIRKRLRVGSGAVISDLGVLDETDQSSRGIEITSRGVVVGSSSDDDLHTAAFRFAEGAMGALPTLAGNATPYAADDDAGIVGVSRNSSSARRAVRWPMAGGAPQDLGTLGGPEGEAVDVGSGGTVVGTAQNADRQWRAFVKPAGGAMRDVQEAAGVPADKREESKAVGVNGDGSVVGCLGYPGESLRCTGDPFRFDSATQTLTHLPLPAGDDQGSALAINDDGVTVGATYKGPSGSSKAARWTGTKVERLPDLGLDGSQAIDINGAGIAVGQGGDHALLWRGTDAQDLNDLVAGTGWMLQMAEGIDDRDEVVGTGVVGGRRHAFQLNLGPCRVCVTHIALEERGPQGTWTPVGPRGTVDGNRVRATISLRNDDDRDHAANVKLFDDGHGEIPDTRGVVALAPGQTEDVVATFSTDGMAWDDKGKPDDDHILRAQASIGRLNYDAQAIDLKVRPRPVVLVHGMASDAATWSSYPSFLRNANPDWHGYAVGDGVVAPESRMDTGDLVMVLHTPNRITENAQIMRTYVEAVREQENAAHVDLVGHSMGGLISRLYVQQLMPGSLDSKPVVRHLLQIGTPNEGSPCADTASVLPMTAPLRPDAMAAFNLAVHDRRGVPISIYAGTNLPLPCPSQGEQGDGVVPISSALWNLADTMRGAYVNHLAMTGSGSIFSDYVLPRLNGTLVPPVAPNTLAAEAHDAADVDPEPAPDSVQLLDEPTATLAARADRDVPVDVDGGSALTVGVVAGPKVTAELVSPSGKVEDRLGADVDAGSLFRALQADAPEPGRWTVRLHNGFGRDAQAALAPRVADDPWSLQVRAGQPGADGALPLIAYLGKDARAQADAAVTATLRRETGDDQQVTLLDDGAHGDGAPRDGCYGAAPKTGAGQALLVAHADTGSVRRERVTWVDVPAGSGEPVRPSCPQPVVGNGELVFGVHDTDSSVITGFDAIGPDGQRAPFPALGPRLRDVAFSPDGTRVSYLSEDGTVVADADGSHPKTIATGRAPAWSPDGTRLALVTRCQGFLPCLSIYDLRNDEVEQIGDGTLLGEDPSWSPDGQRLAFVHRRPARSGCNPEAGGCRAAPELATMAIDGTDLRVLSSDLDDYETPRWSPDGARILFAGAEHGGDHDLYTVGPDGADRRLLTVDEGCHDDWCPEDEYGVWSPDGRRIAWRTGGARFSGQPDGPRQLAVMKADGSARQTLTADALGVGPAAWRPRPHRADAQVPPRCDDLDVRVPQDGAVRVGLSCEDENGDVLVLRVVDPPAHGTVSAVGSDGAVRYAPAGGFAGDDALRYRAEDSSAASSPATVRLHVVRPEPAPPAPTPPSPPAPTDGRPPWTPPANTGSGGHTSTPDPGPQTGGGKITIPGQCVVDVRTGQCMIPVGCPPGATNCTGSIQSPVAGAAAVMAVRGAGSLVRASSFRIRAGRTAKVALRLSPRGRAKLRRRGRLKVVVAIELRQGGRLVARSRRTVTFAVRRSRSAHWMTRVSAWPRTRRA